MFIQINISTDSKRIMCIQLEKMDPNHDLCTLKRSRSWITTIHSGISHKSTKSQFISLNTTLMVHIYKLKNNVTHLMDNPLWLICLHWLCSQRFLLSFLGKEIDLEVFMPFPKWIGCPLERHMQVENHSSSKTSFSTIKIKGTFAIVLNITE